MSLYGNNFYGLFTYGTESLVSFDASPIYATSSDYNTITVNWSKPGGDWSTGILIRNKLGFPVTPDDGELIRSYTQEEHPSQVLVKDTYGLGNNQAYYYSVFVKRTSDGHWFRAGNTMAVSVGNYGTATQMYNMLPTPYKNVTFNTAVLDNSPINQDLYNFLKVFAFEYDLFRAMTDNVRSRYSVDTLNAKLIPVMMDEFGFSFEPEMGIAQGRRLLKNAAEIYLTKGTSHGVVAFVNAFTGYSSKLLPTTNLMLSLEDSSFENTLGFWAAKANCSLTQATGSGESPAVPPYQEAYSPTNFPNSSKGLLKVTASSSGVATLACGADAPITKGVPVVEALDYTFSFYARSKTNTRAVSAKISWYDRFGSIISTDTGTGVTTTTTDWSKRPYVAATAPTGAVFAVPSVSIASNSSGDIHYLDAAQFEEGTSPTVFAESRRINIYLNPVRTNLVQNPSFESATTNWSATSASLSLDAQGATDGSTSSLKITASGTTAKVDSADIEVLPGQDYTASAYVKGPVTDSVVISVKYYDESATYISSSTGTSTTLSATSWNRISVMGTAPELAATAKVELTYTTANSRVNYADSVMFEQDDTLNDYFDGSTGYLQTSDLLWADNDDVNGKSYYYKNRVNVVKRLISAIPEYMPWGSSWAITEG
jgi:hypothetical protein